MLLSDVLKNGLSEPVGPLYSVYRYTDEMYKVIRFHSNKPRCGPVVKRGEKGDPDKVTDLHSSISRAKSTILQLALCNEWDYFCTFTLSSEYDRFDLAVWYKKFCQFIRDQRKKHSAEIIFLLVPETHKDGAWHIHGLIKGAPPLLSFSDRLAAGENIPVYLARNGYSSWPDYEKKFGFNSFGPIRNAVACGFYITKYVTKAIDASCVSSGAHRYYASLGLNRAQKHCDVYSYSQYLDSFLVNHYDFCDTGMTKLSDNLNWTFAFDQTGVLNDLLPFDSLDPAEVSESERIVFEQYFDYIQEKMEGFT